MVKAWVRSDLGTFTEVGCCLVKHRCGATHYNVALFIKGIPTIRATAIVDDYGHLSIVGGWH